MPSRYSISLAAVVALVILRLVIGWHFFSEGVKHHADPNWTSEPVLRSAKGPFASLYQAYLRDFHGFEELMHGRRIEDPKQAVQAWIEQIQMEWADYDREFAKHFGLSEADQKRTAAVLGDYQARLRAWADANQAGLLTHLHQWRRKEAARDAPAGDLPFQKKRVADTQTALSGEAAAWKAELRSLEQQYENALAALVGGESLPHRASSLDIVDAVMTYGILAIGLLLLLGLFTPLACAAGALFLLSVVMMQPFWVSDAAPTYKEYVEMFALVALGTTEVGRWAGLDFFLARLFSRSDRLKGKSDVSES